MSSELCLARVYRKTIQRLACELYHLNSNGVFIFVSYAVSPKVFVWVGSSSLKDDVTVANEIANDIIVEDLKSAAELVLIHEGKENEDSLTELLDLLWVQKSDYEQTENSRHSPIFNSSMSLGVVERKRGSRELRMKFVCAENVTSDGSVPPLPFPISMTTKTVAVVIIGEQYDLLFGSDVTRLEQAAVKTFVMNTALEAVPEEEKEKGEIDFMKNLVVHCNLGSRIFRAFFRSDAISSLRPSTTPATRPPKSKAQLARGMNRRQLQKTDTLGENCTDCVGDTIMRLLGLGGRSDTDSARGSQRDSEEDVEEPAPGPTTVLDSRANVDPDDEVPDEVEGWIDPAEIEAKIQRAQTRTHLQFFTPPRQGFPLLVLDLDHTLMDFSQRFATTNVKRPYLDKFLAEVYLQYDIVIWSQTSWHWLELKLSELSLLRKKDYKICFALDKSSMFTLNQSSVKPLQVIWNLCPERWGPHNTIHVDDLARNFELNLQSGLLVRPFYIQSEKRQLAEAAQRASGKSPAATVNPIVSGEVVDVDDDNELQLLSRYLANIAVSYPSRFHLLNHFNWRADTAN